MTKTENRSNITRRGFLHSAVAGTAVAVVGTALNAALPYELLSEVKENSVRDKLWIFAGSSGIINRRWGLKSTGKM